MRLSHAAWCIPVALLLAACADDPLTPLHHRSVTPTFSASCPGGLDTKLARVPVGQTNLSVGDLPGVTVWATYTQPGGLPFNLMQAMNFGPGTNLWNLPCLEEPGASFTITAAEPEDTLPPPPEVDAGWWTTLSPRERAVLLKFAQTYISLRPDEYTTPGRVIVVEFQDRVPTLKVRAKQRAMDYQLPGTSEELLFGGIYACRIYQNFLFDEFSPLMSDQVAELASSLAAAFGATLNAKTPLRGVLFGKNAATGVGFAARNPHGDCGTMVFQAIGREISVTDPYGGQVPPEPAR